MSNIDSPCNNCCGDDSISFRQGVSGQSSTHAINFFRAKLDDSTQLCGPIRHSLTLSDIYLAYIYILILLLACNTCSCYGIQCLSATCSVHAIDVILSTVCLSLLFLSLLGVTCYIDQTTEALSAISESTF